MLKEQEILEQFKDISNWEDRYRKIIELGKKLPEFPKELQVEENKVKGCQSQVWIVANLDEQGLLHFRGDSDALIVRGLVALLLKFYSGRTPKEVAETEPEFISKLGFAANLTPSRANGLQSMIRQIRFYGLAYQAKLNQSK